MKKYTPPRKEFFMLPNNIFDLPLDVYAFKIYAYLVYCAGNRGECWPSLQKMSSKLGIAVSTVQDRINLLEKRKLISIRKHSRNGKCTPCSLQTTRRSTVTSMNRRNCQCTYREAVGSLFAGR